MNKNIVIVNQDAGYLMVDIANAFVSAGYNVTLVAGKVHERETKLDKNIVLRKIAAYNRLSILKRLISWISGFFEIVYNIRKYHGNDELLIVSNPPIALFVPLFCKNKFNFLVFDVYVNTLQKFVPLKSKSPLVFVWKKLHKFVLNGAKSVFVLTDGMKKTLQPYCKKTDIQILPLWTDNSDMKPVDKSENPFIVENNLQDSFVVFYSGNLGLTSGVENIVELAKLLKNDQRFKFLIIGEGLQMEKIKIQIMENGLVNCLLLPKQSFETMPYTFASADISIVSLSGESSNNSIPSKTYNYLSAGSPILCIANKQSDIAKFIDFWSVGKVFSFNELDGAADYLKELAENNFIVQKLKENSLLTAKKFTSDNANIIVKHIDKN